MFFFPVFLSANIQKLHKTRRATDMRNKRIEDNFLSPLTATGWQASYSENIHQRKRATSEKTETNTSQQTGKKPVEHKLE